MSIEAMKQALEYTRPGAIVPVTPETVKMLVDALRLAIEQAERQEPVAWMAYTLDGKSAFVTDNPADFTESHRALPLYTAPPQRQPLTEEELNHLWETIYDHGNGKYQGEQSRAQRARAFEILKMIGGEG